MSTSTGSTDGASRAGGGEPTTPVKKTVADPLASVRASTTPPDNATMEKAGAIQARVKSNVDTSTPQRTKLKGTVTPPNPDRARKVQEALTRAGASPLTGLGKRPMRGESGQASNREGIPKEFAPPGLTPENRAKNLIFAKDVNDGNANELAELLEKGVGIEDLIKLYKTNFTRAASILNKINKNEIRAKVHNGIDAEKALFRFKVESEMQKKGTVAGFKFSEAEFATFRTPEGQNAINEFLKSNPGNLEKLPEGPQKQFLLASSAMIKLQENKWRWDKSITPDESSALFKAEGGKAIEVYGKTPIEIQGKAVTAIISSVINIVGGGEIHLKRAFTPAEIEILAHPAAKDNLSLRNIKTTVGRFASAHPYIQVNHPQEFRKMFKTEGATSGKVNKIMENAGYTSVEIGQSVRHRTGLARRQDRRINAVLNDDRSTSPASSTSSSAAPSPNRSAGKQPFVEDDVQVLPTTEFDDPKYDIALAALEKLKNAGDNWETVRFSPDEERALFSPAGKMAREEPLGGTVNRTQQILEILKLQRQEEAAQAAALAPSPSAQQEVVKKRIQGALRRFDEAIKKDDFRFTEEERQVLRGNNQIIKEWYSESRHGNLVGGAGAYLAQILVVARTQGAAPSIKTAEQIRSEEDLRQEKLLPTVEGYLSTAIALTNKGTEQEKTKLRRQLVDIRGNSDSDNPLAKEKPSEKYDRGVGINSMLDQVDKAIRDLS